MMTEKTYIPKLYAITDSHLMPDEVLYKKVEQALAAQVKWIQYRDKSGDERLRFVQAKKLLILCKKYNAKLIINDDVKLAKKIGAHGVHLGQTDLSIKTARETLGEKSIIGATCHDSIKLAIKAKEEGASYIAFGRFFASNTKPKAGSAPLELLTKARQVGLPIVAIGGITKDNYQQVYAHGADCIAMCHALFSHDDITTAVEQLSH